MTMLYDIAFLFVALFALGFTIFIHELGHFLAARQRGLIITRFSIGFGPKLFGWTRNGVEYRLSAIPFGGYVALPQLSDMGRLEGNETSTNPTDLQNKEKTMDKRTCTRKRMREHVPTTRTKTNKNEYDNEYEIILLSYLLVRVTLEIIV